MKANRKFKEEDEAVSAVIGVILMVAITVAIAATVYVYVTGMIGGGTTRTPNISCVPDNTNNLLRVSSSDPDVSWTDVNITILANGTDTHYLAKTGTVTAGDTISVDTYLVDAGNNLSLIHI